MEGWRDDGAERLLSRRVDRREILEPESDDECDQHVFEVQPSFGQGSFSNNLLINKLPASDATPIEYWSPSYRMATGSTLPLKHLSHAFATYLPTLLWHSVAFNHYRVSGFQKS